MNYTEGGAAERAGRPSGARNPRADSVTDMAFVDGKLIVAGLSNEEFASKLRSFAVSVRAADPGTSVEIFHGNHGQLETRSPVNTFIPYTIDNKPSRDRQLHLHAARPVLAREPQGLEGGRHDDRRARHRQPAARHDPLQEGRPRVPADVEQQRAA